MDTNQTLHLKYRPTDFDMVLGQDAVVHSLQEFEKYGKWPHSFLFTGDSGCGKTTLARIIATKVGCEPQNLLEIDAASTTGIDAMRRMSQGLQFGGFGGSITKVVILDECHGLSKSSWESLLKLVEEPPDHVYLIFCTTEPGKVPKTIKTRTASYTMRSISQDDIIQLVEDVAVLEEIKLPQHGSLIIAEVAGGSPRQALVCLAQAGGVKTADELKKVVQAVGSSNDVIELCRELILPEPRWEHVSRMINGMAGETQPESARIQIVRYFEKVVLGTADGKRAAALIERMDNFRDPCLQTDGWAPILASCASCIWR